MPTSVPKVVLHSEPRAHQDCVILTKLENAVRDDANGLDVAKMLGNMA